MTTLRADPGTGLGDGWKLYGRIDQPLVYSHDVISGFNKKFFDSFVASLEYSRSLIHDKGFEPYQLQIEARIG